MSQAEINPNESVKSSGGDEIENVNLTMLHLCKLFEEYINLKKILSENERDARLYQML
uniref:Uncharacterized protein n=2 Tax=Anopheles arabiensis TaxID=7173 RepID=A0A182IES9_ANOAR